MVLDRVLLRNDELLHFDLTALLDAQGIDILVIGREADVDTIRPDSPPHLAIVDASSMAKADLRDAVQKCRQLKVPVIALVPEARVGDLDLSLDVDDFLVIPATPGELVARARRAIRQGKLLEEDSDVIRVGDLVINPTGYEVLLRGRRINLRFKEYELLRLLATSPGRVYTREALLSQIWGYDYFGGTRTVDVHIRRLRSKIQDADHAIIETVWNVGYRLRDLGGSG